MEDFRTAYHRELALALDITDGVTAGEDQLPAGWHLRKPVSYTHLTLPTNREV